MSLFFFVVFQISGQKSNHDFEKKYPYFRVGTLVPMHIKIDVPFVNRRFRILKKDTYQHKIWQKGKNDHSC